MKKRLFSLKTTFPITINEESYVTMKVQLMVIFGGKSVEHEISIISALQAINHINKEMYDVIPVYITKEQEMYTGKDIASIEAYQNLPALLKSSQRVVFAKENGRVIFRLF
jgi:D-alanine-D-alanine ligase